MCASDEFHFLPRVQEAGQLFDLVDELSGETIEATLEAVTTLKTRLQGLPEGTDLEEEIDRQLLLHNMAGFLIEFEQVQSWRHNPLLYLKIGCIGLDHALHKPAVDEKERADRTLERLAGLKGLLQQGQENLTNVPGPYYRAALSMVKDAQRYVAEVLQDFEQDAYKKQLALAAEEAKLAVLSFGERLGEMGPGASGSVKSAAVDDLVRNHFGCRRPLEEIYAIAQEEWRDSLVEMEQLRRSIDSRREWQELYEGYHPTNREKPDLFELYGAEIGDLRHFCRGLNLADNQRDQAVILSETPTYLQSVRSAASYSSPLGIDPREQAWFYITSGGSENNSEMDISRRTRLHREYRFLSAHETYPGHHLLDSIRRHLKNPIRRQVESPLFYEGWAYYAESILTDKGHVKEPLELLVNCKRRLWRAARCIIDVGLALERVTREEAAELLVSVTFVGDEALAQVERFRLNPGYQLCYSLGKYEILELRRRFLSKFGWQRFHQILLEGGEIPFHLAAWRFENLADKEKLGSLSPDIS
jgi:uncharacterized protein (DUF885 family)